ncbi:MAG: transglutaminase domain-containing protein, partial [Fibrobacter sp.]|nr:transglutaminase domain-containing protein [Fibrobacter sp.]
SAFLQIPNKEMELLDSVAVAMALPRQQVSGTSEFAVANLKTIQDYFIQNFNYSFTVSGFRANSKTDPLVRFWKNKEGYCEYYATLATLLLRYQGIPARYVTGFANPERVPGRPYVTFRRRHSHAWVEVYIDRKWYIYDPTPPLTEMTFANPSWFAVKLEGLKGRFSYILHLLKDGEWRRVVDSWQTTSERIVGSPVLYVVLTVLLAIFMGLKFRRRRSRIQHAVSKDAARWIALLENAEKRLTRFGFVRLPGETVSAFAKRVEQTSKKASPEDSLYEHACAAALNQLHEYENNRWRSGT